MYFTQKYGFLIYLTQKNIILTKGDVFVVMRIRRKEHLEPSVYTFHIEADNGKLLYTAKKRTVLWKRLINHTFQSLLNETYMLFKGKTSPFPLNRRSSRYGLMIRKLCIQRKTAISIFLGDQERTRMSFFQGIRRLFM